MMKNKLFRLVLPGLILSVGMACGFTTPVSPTASQPTQLTEPTLALPSEMPSEVPSTADSQPTETDISKAETDASKSEADASKSKAGCEEYFRFCVTSTISGAVNATAAAGGGSSVNNCTAWVEDGETRILELPLMLAAGDEKITVALTRIGQYTGPGEYELKAVTTSGLTDMFPAIEVGGRTFSNGEGSTALVTIAADGSGSLLATGLVEQASIQVANPDPAARVDFSMQWTCQGD